MFSNWRPKTTARKFKVQDGADNVNFFVVTQAGIYIIRFTFYIDLENENESF